MINGISVVTGAFGYTGRYIAQRLLEVWPESHRPGLALRQAGVFQSYMAQ